MPIPEFVVELRKRVGKAELWMPAVTAVVLRSNEDSSKEGGAEEVLLVRRADNHAWTLVTGILEPGEEPAVGAAREALEETGVTVRVDRLAAVSSGHRVTHSNGDLAVYLDHTFACSWASGEAHVADDESIDVRWWPLEDLPALSRSMRERLDAALSGEERARFHPA